MTVNCRHQKERGIHRWRRFVRRSRRRTTILYVVMWSSSLPDTPLWRCSYLRRCQARPAPSCWSRGLLAMIRCRIRIFPSTGMSRRTDLYSTVPRAYRPARTARSYQRLYTTVTVVLEGGVHRYKIYYTVSQTRGQSNLTKSASRGPIPRLGVTPGGRKLYHWIPGVGFPISVP